MITQETAALIYHAYRELEAGQKLLDDMKTIREREHLDKTAPTIRDAFGQPRHLQLGIPSGENAHRILNVSPVLAESVIRAHIENKRAELATIQERARIELEGGEG
ncbi:hypothetical protein IB236_12845 [Acidovorax sp. ACV02]|jgi:hypothetical protein|uniref:hypothetical protein n=1 Tax=Acidovorax sp. ACV02 TaxID=2769310 RepID=UPI001786292D|nr:hypothetical protein [Acidovorax sp. ACV02]MBD9406228.1 hypothetical protein [Acidovorax sp. ACV02]